MTERKPGKASKGKPASPVEIKEEDLDKASGGAADQFRSSLQPRSDQVSSGPGDEGPEESITFVYGKL